MAMDLRKIKKLIELVNESGIAELAITEGEESIRITRYSPMSTSVQSQQTIPTARVAPLSAQAKQTAVSPSAEGFVQVSPMVGTFYATADVGEAPLVKVGQRVSQGEVICIIEAMGMTNPIEAERDGVIRAIWVKDGDEVAFDQPLFTIN
jgi:acetyl-CoA carboxylase biotin carboxyl carrier protein